MDWLAYANSITLACQLKPQLSLWLLIDLFWYYSHYDSNLESTVLSYIEKGDRDFAVYIDIFELFATLKDIIDDNLDVPLKLNCWQVEEATLATDCQLEDESDAPKLGYLFVNAPEEFISQAKFLMCDYVDAIADRWCQLTNYDRNGKDSDEMLNIISNYSYHKESTNIKIGLVSSCS